jgi:hypothetical protein
MREVLSRYHDPLLGPVSCVSDGKRLSSPLDQLHWGERTRRLRSDSLGVLCDAMSERHVVK